MKKLITILSLVLMTTCLISQEEGQEGVIRNGQFITELADTVADTVDQRDYSIKFDDINCSKAFKSLVEKRIAYNEQEPYIVGYRVLLKTSTSMEEIMALRSRFLELFPNEPILIEENMPFFLLRAGNHIGVWGIWKAKLHAILLERYFENAVYVKTKIHMDDLMETSDDR